MIPSTEALRPCSPVPFLSNVARIIQTFSSPADFLKAFFTECCNTPDINVLNIYDTSTRSYHHYINIVRVQLPEAVRFFNEERQLVPKLLAELPIANQQLVLAQIQRLYLIDDPVVRSFADALMTALSPPNALCSNNPSRLATTILSAYKPFTPCDETNDITLAFLQDFFMVCCNTSDINEERVYDPHTQQFIKYLDYIQHRLEEAVHAVQKTPLMIKKALFELRETPKEPAPYISIGEQAQKLCEFEGPRRTFATQIIAGIHELYYIPAPQENSSGETVRGIAILTHLNRCLPLANNSSASLPLNADDYCERIQNRLIEILTDKMGIIEVQHASNPPLDISTKEPFTERDVTRYFLALAYLETRGRPLKFDQENTSPLLLALLPATIAGNRFDLFSLWAPQIEPHFQKTATLCKMIEQRVLKLQPLSIELAKTLAPFFLRYKMHFTKTQAAKRVCETILGRYTEEVLQMALSLLNAYDIQNEHLWSRLYKQTVVGLKNHPEQAEFSQKLLKKAPVYAEKKFLGIASPVADIARLLGLDPAEHYVQYCIAASSGLALVKLIFNFYHMRIQSLARSHSNPQRQIFSSLRHINLLPENLADSVFKELKEALNELCIPYPLLQQCKYISELVQQWDKDGRRKPALKQTITTAVYRLNNYLHQEEITTENLCAIATLHNLLDKHSLRGGRWETILRLHQLENPEATFLAVSLLCATAHTLYTRGSKLLGTLWKSIDSLMRPNTWMNHASAVKLQKLFENATIQRTLGVDVCLQKAELCSQHVRFTAQSEELDAIKRNLIDTKSVHKRLEYFKEYIAKLRECKTAYHDFHDELHFATETFRPLMHDTNVAIPELQALFINLASILRSRIIVSERNALIIDLFKSWSALYFRLPLRPELPTIFLQGLTKIIHHLDASSLFEIIAPYSLALTEDRRNHLIAYLQENTHFLTNNPENNKLAFVLLLKPATRNASMNDREEIEKSFAAFETAKLPPETRQRISDRKQTIKTALDRHLKSPQ